MEVRILLFFGFFEVQTLQLHAIIGIPCEVPVPRKVIFITIARVLFIVMSQEGVDAVVFLFAAGAHLPLLGIMEQPYNDFKVSFLNCVVILSLYMISYVNALICSIIRLVISVITSLFVFLSGNLNVMGSP